MEGRNARAPAADGGSAKSREDGDKAKSSDLSPLGRAAVAYAERGRKILPVWWLHEDGSCACWKGADCKSPGKHPIFDDWISKASSDVEVIRGWWQRFPSANIGQASAANRVVVLDFDDLEAYERLVAEFGPLPDTLVVHSPRPGLHVYLRDAGVPLRGDLPGGGGEVKQDGQTLLPPSRQVKGTYRWGEHDTLAEIPEAWLEALRKAAYEGNGEHREPRAEGATAYGVRALEGALDDIRECVEGERHEAIRSRTMWLAGLAKAGELDWELVRERAYEVAAEIGKDDVGEITRLLDGAWAKAEPAEPRTAAKTLEAGAGPELEKVSPVGDKPPRAAVRLVDGRTFALSEPRETPSVWGKGSEVLWSEGEPFLLAGPPGVGKTTVIQQFMLARIGLVDEVLGFPVKTSDRRVLYLACDRPAQAARSLSRMVWHLDEEQLAVLAEKLVVWRGPLDFDIAAEPEGLLRLAEENEAGTVVLDSLKDVAMELTKDDVGQKVNRALQTLVSNDVEAGGLHHQRKAVSGNTKPKGLDDVYGSRWLTSGAGSVVLLWGEAGDPVVDLIHLKQPAEPVGPMKLIHDHEAGETTVLEQADLVEVVGLVPGGVTAQIAAGEVTGKTDPSRADVEKVRRRLERLVDLGRIRKEDRGGRGRGGSVVSYFPVEEGS